MVRFLTIALIVSVFVVGCVRPDSVMSSRVSQFIPIDSIVIDHSDLGLVLWGPRLIEREGSHRFCLVDDNNIYTDYDLQTGKRLTSIDLKPWLLKAGVGDDATVCATVWLHSNVLAIICLDQIGVVLVDIERVKVAAHLLNPISDSSGTYFPMVNPTSCEPLVIKRDKGEVNLILGLQRIVGTIASDDEWRQKKYSHAPFTIFNVSEDLSLKPMQDIGSFPEHYRHEVVRLMVSSLACTDSSAIIAFETDSLIAEYSLVDGRHLRSFVVRGVETIKNSPYGPGNTDPKYDRIYYYTSTRAPWVKATARRVMRGVVPGKELPEDKIVPREYGQQDWKIVYRDDKGGDVVEVDLSGLMYHSHFFETIGSDIFLLRNTGNEAQFTIVRGRCE